MAFIWFIMLAVSLGLMIFSDPAAAVNAMIDGAHGAVELALNLMALYAFWLGFFALIERLGLSRLLERMLRPIISRLFPQSDQETRKYITMNVSANLLGLGNAATPMAINAIKGMERTSGGTARATTDMIMLTVISATSLQILPTTVIGMRATAGSVNPSDFLFPSLVATVLSTIIGIVGVKLCSKIFDRKTAADKHGGTETVPNRSPMFDAPKKRPFARKHKDKREESAARKHKDKRAERTAMTGGGT